MISGEIILDRDVIDLATAVSDVLLRDPLASELVQSLLHDKPSKQGLIAFRNLAQIGWVVMQQLKPSIQGGNTDG